jgi:IS5 family transposase
MSRSLIRVQHRSLRKSVVLQVERSTAVDGRGILIGTVTALANLHDSPLLTETLDAVSEILGELPKQVSVHLDRGYESKATRKRLGERGLKAEISEKGKPARWPQRGVG